MGKGRDLTEGPVRAHLTALGAPMIVGIVAVLSISLADAFFLGRLGTDELSAISFTFPVVLTLSSLAIGLGAGAASVVSRAIGAGEQELTRRLATDSLVLAFVVVAAVSALGWLTIRPLFGALGAEGRILDLVAEYMRIWYLGMPFLVIPMVANNLLRAGGDAFYPSLIMVAAAIINVALDPLFIYGVWWFPELGVAGAAWASLSARAATLVISLGFVIFREHLLVFSLPSARAVLHSWRQVLTIGIPAAAGNMVNPIAIAVVTAILAGYSTTVVASFGVATRIESFAAIPMLALSAAIGPIAGQNWGAEQGARVRRALQESYVFCLIWSVLIAAVLWLGAPTIAGWFSDDPVVVTETVRYLRIVPSSLAGYGAVIVGAAAYNAMNKPLTGLTYYLVRTAILYVPLSWAASRFFDPEGVYVAIAIANVVAGLFAAVWSLRWLSKATADPISEPR